MIADVGSGCGQDAVVDWIGKVVSEAGEPEPEPEPEPKRLMCWRPGWAGVGGLAGHAVNPSLEARGCHPWRPTVPPTHPRQPPIVCRCAWQQRWSHAMRGRCSFGAAGNHSSGGPAGCGMVGRDRLFRGGWVLLRDGGGRADRWSAAFGADRSTFTSTDARAHVAAVLSGPTCSHPWGGSTGCGVVGRDRRLRGGLM